MSLVVKNNALKYENLYKAGHNHSYPNLDFVRLERKFLRYKSKVRILDYGFGTGENLIHLLKNNYDVYGVEYVTSNTGTPKRQSSFEQPTKKILVGDFSMWTNRSWQDDRTRWHWLSDKRRTNLLFIDMHVEFYSFPAAYNSRASGDSPDPDAWGFY